MRLKEWLDRCAKPGKVHGLEIDLNLHRQDATHSLPDITYRYIRQVVPMDDDQVQVWTLRKEGWPSGDVMITILTRTELAAAEVLSHANEDWAVYDGDEIMLSDIHLAGFGSQISGKWITDTKMIGMTLPNSMAIQFTGILDGDDPHVVQFSPGMVGRIRRLEP